MSDIWEEIRKDYTKAKNALWCPKHANGWIREEEKGRYHMWKAYHLACETEPKDFLLFARILSMMADENRNEYSEYDRYKKFVKPAEEAYRKAQEEGQRPTEKELENILFYAESLSYKFGCEDAPYEEHIKHIQGSELLETFEFHDSKPIWFEQSEQSARLKLKYDSIIATFLFEGLIDIYVEGDPLSTWISDFYCYPCFHNKDLLTFDLGYYKIICSSISVEKIERDE